MRESQKIKFSYYNNVNDRKGKENNRRRYRTWKTGEVETTTNVMNIF